MRVHLEFDGLDTEQLRDVVVVGVRGGFAKVRCDGPDKFGASMYDVEINTAAALLWSLSGEPT